MRITYRCISVCLLLIIFLITIALFANARDTRQQLMPVKDSGFERTDRLLAPDGGPLFAPTQVDTYLLAEYDFDSGTQGWTSADVTLQDGVFFHVDDFSGLTGYSILEGTQSLWCGKRPDAANPFCHYKTLPGYGNGWFQWFESETFTGGKLTLSYKIAFDVEEYYDPVYVQIDTAGMWENVLVNGGSEYYDSISGPIVDAITVSPPDSTARFRFLFKSDPYWSDEDGFYPTQTGAVVIDSIRVINTIDYLLTSVGSYDTPGNAMGVYAGAKYAYIADYAEGLHIIDITTPSAPTWVATCNTPGSAYDVDIEGDYAYVADGTAGLAVIDISKKSSPSLLTNFDLGDWVLDVEVEGNYAYVAAYGAGLKIVDITTPSSPSVTGTYDTSGLAWGLVLRGDYAYVADYGSGLQIISILLPSTPTFVGNYNTTGFAYDVAVSGDYAYVADGGEGLAVIYLDPLTAPSFAGGCDTPDDAFGIAVSGDYAYIACSAAGLQSADITAPASPEIVGGYDSPGVSQAVMPMGDYFYIADGLSGLRVLDELIDIVEERDYEDFEDESVGDTAADRWTAFARPGYGDYAVRLGGSSVLQEDECSHNSLYFWGFFNGSTYDYSCGGHAEQPAVPFGTDDDVYMRNEIRSPWIEIDGGGSIPASATGMLLEFMVYRDLPVSNLVFYTWRVRSKTGESGCHGLWKNQGFVYHGDGKDWFTPSFEIGDLIDPGATHMQVALSCYDMMKEWGGLFGSGDCHSHAPLFDNVKIRRMDAGGPIWSAHSQDLFQDNFPGDGTITGTARIDAARNTCRRECTCSAGDYLAQDFLVVKVWEPDAGLATDSWSGSAAVHCYVKSSAGYTAIQMQSPASRPRKTTRFMKSPDPPNSNGFSEFAMDTLFFDDFNSCGNYYWGTYYDKFCFDLNDNLFIPGDTIFYYFGAVDNNSNTTFWSEFTGAVTDQSVVEAAPMEMMCLPGGGYANGGDILYVDNCDHEDTQQYFDSAFELLGILDKVDRFDIRGTAEGSDNGLETHVYDMANQLQDCYRKIIWSSGTIQSGTIGDGTGYPNKLSDDADLLFNFLNTYPFGTFAGLYLVGDNIAEEMKSLTGPGVALFFNFMRYNLISGNHRAFGMPSTPMLYGTGEPFYNGGNPDSLFAATGCPVFRTFDVLEPYGSFKGMQYDNYTDHCGLVTLTGLSSYTYPVYTVLQGVGLSAVRDDRPGFPPDRVRLLERVIEYLGNTLPDPTGGGAPPAYENKLVQNYPNPFNPVTTVPFSLKEHSQVTISVYNVAGQLVQVLVDEARDAGIYTDVTWDGRDARGNLAASGVYFYKMQVNDFVKTRKMVLLK